MASLAAYLITLLVVILLPSGQSDNASLSSFANGTQDLHSLHQTSNGKDFDSDDVICDGDDCSNERTGQEIDESKQTFQKCCGNNEYMNPRMTHCNTSEEDMPNSTDLMSKFLPEESSLNATLRYGNRGRLECHRGKPKPFHVPSVFLNPLGQLCEKVSGVCHPPSSFCLENVWIGTHTRTAAALVCKAETFMKCCPKNEILSDTGCINGSGKSPSKGMVQILETFDPFSALNIQKCKARVPKVLSGSSEKWFDLYGNLLVDTIFGMQYVGKLHYCADDYVNKRNEMQLMANVCAEKMVEINSFTGKCCFYGEQMHINSTSHLSSCRTGTQVLNLETDPLVMSSGSILVYGFLPYCNNETGTVTYPLNSNNTSDYGMLLPEGQLEVVTMDNGCLFGKETYKQGQFCLDYIAKDEEDPAEPVVMVCGKPSETVAIRSKHIFVTVLMSLSCIALVFTIVSLATAKVRRGFTTIKKARTLPGKIQISYVAANLAAFVMLIFINQKVYVKDESVACRAIAGLLTFFLLAGFTWNTSICIESLLITVRVGSTEKWRFAKHCLWAWGVPGVIVTLALLLDAFRASLPCSIITPKIGIYYCFFSDKMAQLVFVYVPIFITLLINIGSLAMSRWLRYLQLKKLECSAHATTDEEGEGGDASAAKPASNQPKPSGMRKHQDRNLWMEALKLGMWSGGTWIIEVLIFVVNNFALDSSSSSSSSSSSPEWYAYIVVIAFHSLRGVGIFFILWLTPENSAKAKVVMTRLCRRVQCPDALSRCCSSKRDAQQNIQVLSNDAQDRSTTTASRFNAAFSQNTEETE